MNRQYEHWQNRTTQHDWSIISPLKQAQNAWNLCSWRCSHQKRTMEFGIWRKWILCLWLIAFTFTMFHIQPYCMEGLFTGERIGKWYERGERNKYLVFRSFSFLLRLCGVFTNALLRLNDLRITSSPFDLCSFTIISLQYDSIRSRHLRLGSRSRTSLWRIFFVSARGKGNLIDVQVD